MNEIIQINDDTLKNKKFISKMCKLTDEQVKQFIDDDIINNISKLDVNTINNIFRNSSAIMQNKMWENENIQQSLILGTKNIDNFRVNLDSIRRLEVFSKVIKSQSIKKNIYKNYYFQIIASYIPETEHRFFKVYDVTKAFDEIIKSKRFNESKKNIQFCILEYLNSHSKKLLLPSNFRENYKSIDDLLIDNYWKEIDKSILSQLTDSELFFLDVVAKHNNNESIKKYILDNLKSDKTFDEFFESVKEQNSLIYRKLRINHENRRLYINCPDLEKTVFDIMIKDLKDEEIIVEKFLKSLIQKINLRKTNVKLENVYNTLKRNYYNEILSYDDVKTLVNKYNNDMMDIILKFYLKFNIVLKNVGYLSGISAEQLEKVNAKHINKLYKLLEDKTQDEISSIYGVCIKLYMIFGYERALEILNGKYGKYNSIFLNNVAKTNVTKIKMKQEGEKYLPDINNRFINFMFETPTRNHFINMLNNKDSELYKRWYYIYNNYNDILEKCQGNITMKKIEKILETEKYDLSLDIITPDNYMLKNNSFLENIVLGNKTKHSNDEILMEIIKIYNQMKKRIESSIPYIKGTASNGYSYEMLKFDDIQIFELGYKANCCIRVKDIAHNHLLYSALCRNGRTLLIYNKLGDLMGFCPLKRNGNVLIANSIECTGKKTIENFGYLGLCFKEASKSIIDITNNEKEPIDIVCIGNSSYAKPETIPFPKNYLTPTIFEKDDEIYGNTDSYHKYLDVVCTKKDFKYENIKNQNPNVSYMDPREKIKYVNFRDYNIDKKESLNVINSINYSLNREQYTPINKFSIVEVYYSKDWYVANLYGEIVGKYLENDPRAKIECETYLNKLKSLENNKVLQKI
ncbi:MAG: hypothetical protein IJO43_04960 [Bacilli bacterium]|nr:hypothetical protein [Bacilli bacterium]